MIKEYVKNLKEDQKEFYMNRRKIIEEALTDRKLDNAYKRNRLSSKSLQLVRDHVLGFEGEENSASFDEGTLSGVEDFAEKIDMELQLIITNTRLSNRFSDEYVAGMQKMYDIIIK